MWIKTTTPTHNVTHHHNAYWCSLQNEYGNFAIWHAHTSTIKMHKYGARKSSACNKIGEEREREEERRESKEHQIDSSNVNVIDGEKQVKGNVKVSFNRSNKKTYAIIAITNSISLLATRQIENNSITATLWYT